MKNFLERKYASTVLAFVLILLYGWFAYLTGKIAQHILSIRTGGLVFTTCQGFVIHLLTAAILPIVCFIFLVFHEIAENIIENLKKEGD